MQRKQPVYAPIKELKKKKGFSEGVSTNQQNCISVKMVIVLNNCVE